MIDLDVSELALYFGDDYVINEYITITQPTIDQIVKYGEASYFSMVHTLTAIPSDMKSIIWDQMQLDWTKIEDFELFMILSQTLTPDKTGILFGDLDFSKLRPFNNNQNDEVVLANKETGLIIDKLIYTRIAKYLRKLHGITPKPEKAKGLKIYTITHDSFIYHTTNSHLGEVRSVKNVFTKYLSQTAHLRSANHRSICYLRVAHCVLTMIYL